MPIISIKAMSRETNLFVILMTSFHLISRKQKACLMFISAHTRCRGGQEPKRSRRDSPQTPFEHRVGQRWLNENRSAVRVSFNCQKCSRKILLFQSPMREMTKNATEWYIDIFYIHSSTTIYCGFMITKQKPLSGVREGLLGGS